MRFLNGLLIIAVVAFMTACGGGAKTGNTEGTGTDSAATETANADNTEKKNEDTSSETKAPKAIAAQKWGYDVDAMISMMVEQTPEEKRSEITDEQKAKMKEGISKAYMELMADGTYMGMSPFGQEEKGTWTLSEDGKTLTTKEEGKDKEETLTVKELSAEKMVLETGEGEKKVTVTMIPFKGESTEGTTETKEGEKKEGETKEGEKKEGEKKEGETTEEKK